MVSCEVTITKRSLKKPNKYLNYMPPDATVKPITQVFVQKKNTQTNREMCSGTDYIAMFLHFLLCAHVLCWFRREHYPEEQKLRGAAVARRLCRRLRGAKAAAARPPATLGGARPAPATLGDEGGDLLLPWCRRTTRS
jgi:hypothetical protein